MFNARRVLASLCGVLLFVMASCGGATGNDHPNSAPQRQRAERSSADSARFDFEDWRRNAEESCLRASEQLDQLAEEFPPNIDMPREEAYQREANIFRELNDDLDGLDTPAPSRSSGEDREQQIKSFVSAVREITTFHIEVMDSEVKDEDLDEVRFYEVRARIDELSVDLGVSCDVTPHHSRYSVDQILPSTCRLLKDTLTTGAHAVEIVTGQFPATLNEIYDHGFIEEMHYRSEKQYRGQFIEIDMLATFEVSGGNVVPTPGGQCDL